MRSRPFRRCSKPIRCRSGSWLSAARIAGEILSRSRSAMRSHADSTWPFSAGFRSLLPSPRHEPGGSSDLSTGARSLGRPLALVLPPHPLGLLDRLTPLRRRGLLPGCGPLRGHRLFRGNRRAQLGVILLSIARLGLAATSPGRPAAATAPLVIPTIRVPIGRHVGVIGPVDSHRTSPPPYRGVTPREQFMAISSTLVQREGARPTSGQESNHHRVGRCPPLAGSSAHKGSGASRDRGPNGSARASRKAAQEIEA